MVVVGRSLGAFTAPLVAAQEKADRLVLVAPMISLPGETVSQWWSATGYIDAARERAAADGGLTGRDDHFLPPGFGRRLARGRLAVGAEELPSGHCAMLSHPVDLAEALLYDLS